MFRPFRTPAVPSVTLGIAFSLLLMVFLPWETWLRLIVWLAIGLVIYSAFGRSHSVLMTARSAERRSRLQRIRPRAGAARRGSAMEGSGGPPPRRTDSRAEFSV